MGNIFFIGGIHGVGKSTVCDEICKLTQLNYLSASNLIKWSAINEDPNNKKVFDIDNTQRKLLKGLRESIELNKNYLLDGHYCLLDKESKVSKIPISLFEGISPSLLCLITGDISEIKKNIEARDERLYDYNLLFEMQEQELAHAKNISTQLSIELVCGTKKDFWEINAKINQLIDESTSRY